MLAQQANFSYASSQLASKTWYQALTAGYSCAEALFEVRQALLQDEHPDWAVPVLYGSAASLAPLLDPAAPAGAPDSRLTSQSRALSLPTPTGVFVGRHRELRDIEWEDPTGRDAAFFLDGQLEHAVERVIPSLARQMGYHIVWR